MLKLAKVKSAAILVNLSDIVLRNNACTTVAVTI